jgi:CheY-like chemotaxis protein
MPRTLFLADDSVTIRKVVELAFHDTDVRVVAVGSGREALERLPSAAPDIVLADVVMPGPSGYEVCRTVKASSKPVPVLLLAGTFEPFDADEARDCGADGYVTKPFDSRALVERIETILSGRGAPKAFALPVRPTPPPPPAPPPSPPSPPPPPPPIPLPDPEVEAMFLELVAPPAPIVVPEPAVAVAAVMPSPEPAPAPAPAPTAALVAPAPPPPPALTALDIDAIARAVVARLTDQVVREIAWDVVPDVAEAVVRERLRELERETD